jgi:altronate dehydratase large subunit
VVVVGLGCERFLARELQESIAEAGKPVETLVIQEEGDTLRSIEKGITLAVRLVEEASRQRPEAFPISDLSLGLKCGGTDTTSGIAANATLGWVTDELVAAGGRAIFTEVTELIGAEKILASRAATPKVAGEILATVGNMEKRLSAATASREVQHRSALISPGNEDGEGSQRSLRRPWVGSTRREPARSAAFSVTVNIRRVRVSTCSTALATTERRSQDSLPQVARR